MSWATTPHAAAVYVTDAQFLKDFRGMDYITVCAELRNA